MKKFSTSSSSLTFFYFLFFGLMFFLLQSGCTSSRETTATTGDFKGNMLRVMFYNVENLFDTINNSGINDADFTPNGSKKWTSERYGQKLENLSEVITKANAEQRLVLLGICEVENRQVLLDLASTSNKTGTALAVVHEDSPDARGIDVALLYDSLLFETLHHHPLRVEISEDGSATTRDILYVKGVLLKLDTFHVFVNHWPSRRGGEAVSEPKRMQAATVLRQMVDSLVNIHRAPKIIIMGDFNDEPNNRSIMKLESIPITHPSFYLFNMMHNLLTGTYKYREKWNMLDQIIISSPLLDTRNKIYVEENSVSIFNRDFLLIEDTRNSGQRPFSTYTGNTYNGGFSDHLPVILDLNIRR